MVARSLMPMKGDLKRFNKKAPQTRNMVACAAVIALSFFVLFQLLTRPRYNAMETPRWVSPMPPIRYQKNDEWHPKVTTTLLPDSCNPPESAFNSIYINGVWNKGGKLHPADYFYNNAKWPPKKRQSSSGLGSNLGALTEKSLQFLREAIQEHHVETMIDLPCGDVNWIFDSLETDTLKLYLGLDIADVVIGVNAQRFLHHSNKLFRHWDGSSCPLPKYILPQDAQQSEHSFDLIHSRDVLQHLPLDQSLPYLCHVFSSGAKLFMTTTYPNATNRDIKQGDWFENNLEAPPFNLPKHSDGEVKCVITHPEVEGDWTCLYNLTQRWVTEWIAENNCSERA